MNDIPTGQQSPEPEAPERISRQGRGLAKIFNPSVKTDDDELSAPRVINSEHRRPEPRAPRWRSVQAVNAEHEKLLARAAAAKAAADALERDFDAKERRINSLNHIIQLKDEEVKKFRQYLAELEPDSLNKRLEEWYWAHVYSPFDQHATNQFLIAGNLAANSKRLRTLLESKIAENDRGIAEAAAEVAALEAQLEAATAGAETV